MAKYNWDTPETTTKQTTSKYNWDVPETTKSTTNKDESVIDMAKDYLKSKWQDATSSKKNILKTVGNLLISATPVGYAIKTAKNLQGVVDATKNTNAQTTGKESAFGTAGNIATSATRGFLNTAEGVADLIQYGVAGGAELVGAKKTKEWFIDAAKMNTTDRLLKTQQEYYNPKAIQGFKQGQIGSSIAEGVGGVAAQIGMANVGGQATGKVTQAIKNYSPMFASSTGGGISEGLNAGADMGTSITYGIGKGAIDTLSELAFGGIAGTGKGALDDKLVGAATKNITNVVKKKLLTMGIKGVFEGLEENIAGYLTPKLQQMTIDPNAQEYFKDEKGKFTLTKAGLDFLIGAITSAIAQSALPTPAETTTPEAITPSVEQQTTPSNINIPTTQQTAKYNPTVEYFKSKGLSDELAEFTSRNAMEMMDNKSPTIKDLEDGKFGYDRPIKEKTTIYRVVPKNENINISDFVFTTKQDAETFRENYGYNRGQQEIVSKEVNGQDLIVPLGNYKNEAIYYPTNLPSMIEQENVPEVLRINIDKTTDIKPKDETIVLSKIPKEKGLNRQQALYDAWQQAIVNDHYKVDEMAKKTGNENIKYLANNAAQSSSSTQYTLAKEFRDINGQKLGKGLQQTFQPFEGKEADLQDFYNYLANKHHIDRTAQGKPVLGDKPIEASTLEVENLEQKHPEFKQYAQDVYDYNNNLLKIMVQGGILNQNQVDTMQQMYPNYIPTYRSRIGTGGITSFGNRLSTSSPVKKATGGSSNILPIEEQMASQTVKTMNAVRKNLMFLEILNTVRNNPQTANTYAVEVNKEKISPDDNFLANVDETLVKKPEGNFVTVYENGEKVQLEVSDDLYKSLKSFTGDTLANRLVNTSIVKPLATGIRTFKGLLTAYNPLFTPVNAIRDLQDSLLYSKNTGKFISNYPEAIKEVATNGDAWNVYQSLGGFQSSVFQGGEFVKDTGFKKIRDKAFYLNEVVEQLPRFNEFLTIYKQNPTDYNNLMKGMYAAADITVNFGRGGELTKALDKTLVPFLNAGVQGLDKAIRTVTSVKTGREAITLIGKAALLGILPSLFNELMYGDDDDYKNLENYLKDTNYLIKTSSGKFIKIPKGRMLSALGSPVQRTVRAAKGEKDAFKELGTNILGQTAPSNPISNNIFSAFTSVKSNKDWRGNNIVPQRLQSLPAEYQYDEKTTAIAKNLGHILKISPKKIDYVLKQYSGVIGQVVMPLTTPTAEQNPLLAKFMIDPVYSNKNVGLFYDAIDKLSKDKNADITSSADNSKLRGLNVNKKKISNRYKEIRDIQSSKLTDKEKMAKSRKIQQEINKIAESALLKYGK